MTVRLGLLTTADINQAILGARAPDAPFEVVAVGSRDAGRAEAYARTHGIPRAHGSYEAVLADDELDAVYVALPNALHHEWTMQALAAGKHVLCEKPYTRKPEEVVEAWDEAERQHVVLAEGYMWRHSNQTRLLRELIPTVGSLQAVSISFFGILSRLVDVRFLPELGGGALLDLGCYCVSAARLLAGREPVRVHGEAVAGRGGVDEIFAGTLHFGEFVATFQCGFTARINRIVAVGVAGTLEVPEAFVNPPGTVVVDGHERRVEGGNAYANELDDFCAAIQGERKPLLGQAEMLGQARALDALLRSSATGTAVEL